MINSSNQSSYFTRQTILWRLLVTVILLLILAGSGLTIFRNISDPPNAQVLPAWRYEFPGR
jgi:hypothetical protein